MSIRDVVSGHALERHIFGARADGLQYFPYRLVGPDHPENITAINAPGSVR